MDCSSRHFQRCWCPDVEEGSVHSTGARLKLTHRQDIHFDITMGHKESHDTPNLQCTNVHILCNMLQFQHTAHAKRLSTVSDCHTCYNPMIRHVALNMYEQMLV